MLDWKTRKKRYAQNNLRSFALPIVFTKLKLLAFEKLTQVKSFFYSVDSEALPETVRYDEVCFTLDIYCGPKRFAIWSFGEFGNTG